MHAGDRATVLGLFEDIHRCYDRLPPRPQFPVVGVEEEPYFGSHAPPPEEPPLPPTAVAIGLLGEGGGAGGGGGVFGDAYEGTGYAPDDTNDDIMPRPQPMTDKSVAMGYGQPLNMTLQAGEGGEGKGNETAQDVPMDIVPTRGTDRSPTSAGQVFSTICEPMAPAEARQQRRRAEQGQEGAAFAHFEEIVGKTAPPPSGVVLFKVRKLFNSTVYRLLLLVVVGTKLV